MRDFAPIQLMIPRIGKFVCSLAAPLFLVAAFQGQASVPFSLDISGNYGNGFFGDYPYFVIHNESRYSITQFEITIGNIDKNFDGVWFQYVPHGSMSFISPDTNLDGGIRSDTLKVS